MMSARIHSSGGRNCGKAHKVALNVSVSYGIYSLGHQISANHTPRGRRRKIRCIYPSGESRNCSPCSARGAQCKSQSASLVFGSDAETMTLRDRVTRLESILENVLQSLPSSRVQLSNSVESARNLSDTEDDVGPWDRVDPRVPFVFILNDAEVSYLVQDLVFGIMY